MSKTPAIDPKAIRDLATNGADAETLATLKENPLSTLVDEFDEFSDIAVSPAFKSLKDQAEAVADGALVKQAHSDPLDPYQAILPTAAPSKTPKSIYRISTETSADPLAMPTRKASVASATTGVEVMPALESTPKESTGMRGLAIAAVTLIAVGGAGYLYVQGTQSASSETVVYSVPVFDDVEIEAATANDPIEIAEFIPAVAMPPTTVAPQPLGFDDSLSDTDPALEGQSLLDLATGVPAYSPSEIVPDSEWQDVSCGGCHSFDQADLCKQGAYYFNHDKSRLTRIQHPYGGGYKAKLMEWAEGGCK